MNRALHFASLVPLLFGVLAELASCEGETATAGLESPPCLQSAEGIPTGSTIEVTVYHEGGSEGLERVLGILAESHGVFEQYGVDLPLSAEFRVDRRAAEGLCAARFVRPVWFHVGSERAG